MYSQPRNQVPVGVVHKFLDLLLLMIELLLVLLGLFCHHSVVGFHPLYLVDESIALEDEYILRLSVLIRQVVSGNLVIIGSQALQYVRLAQPPVFIGHSYRRIASYRGLNLLADISGKGDGIKRAQIRIDMFHQNIPSCHTRVFLLIRVQRMVPLVVVTAVIRHKLIE